MTGEAEGASPESAKTIPRPKMLPMVGWYDPKQLFRTAQEVVVSTLFGRHADYRIIEALAAAKTGVDDEYRSHGGDFWIDYVADAGDGWNSTYAVARAVAQENLVLQDGSGATHATSRGAVLIFGGDAVYPVANRTAYKERLLAPYETALRNTPAPHHPSVYAIPGNHDWYDSLVAFMRLFCAGRWFGGWRTRQTRSYFALALPRGWWLVGTDVQLGSDIDAPQAEFFKSAAARMQADDRVILCNSEPHWIYAHIYGNRDRDYNESNLAYLEDKVFGSKVKVFLAGDLHHYRRHEALSGGVHKITAGGGGAFLHPTHGPEVASISDGQYTFRKAFPDPAISRRLCWKNLLFPFLNLRFGKITAFLYVITAWAAMVDLSRYGPDEFGQALGAAFRNVVANPVAGFCVVLTFMGFLLFTDTHSPSYRWIGGTLHALAHLFAVFLIGWGAGCLTTGWGLAGTSQLLIAAFLIAAGGWIVGSFIMGIYLLVSLNVFGRHGNEAFSSLGIEDWKSFVRMKVDAQGRLTIYPIGLRRVPRRWENANAGTGGPELVPAPGDAATAPELIEGPIVVEK